MGAAGGLGLDFYSFPFSDSFIFPTHIFIFPFWGRMIDNEALLGNRAIHLTFPASPQK